MNSFIRKFKKKDIVDDSGRISWISPSNIALVKYWGKFGDQLPSNPSISLTLNEAKTTMDFSWSPKDKDSTEVQLDFYFEGKKNESFQEKISKYLVKHFDYFPFLRYISLEIESTNTFPHSAGIASSASSMSALALGLCTIESEVFGLDLSQEEIKRKATFMARLASGSACRSIYGGVVSWGDFEHQLINSTNEIAGEVLELDEVFKTYQDTILIVDSGQKAVSSRAGHALMTEHPFSQIRFSNARTNIEKIIKAMQTADLLEFCNIVESEALELHGLMMNSNPSFILMRPNTLAIIERIRDFRERTSLPVCFTLDAGPNVHILYPENISEQVKEFIISELSSFTESNKIIYDHVGTGPERYL
ncbi:diphosphomevalonate decarboxylase [Halobacteriovorax sp. HLS]|uniref:diphosphomevalonate decarboxylase n=1 Tax=Halobacteriovorax sp. HLS TaxID=2234000 RepID=UPI000FD83BC2|nr:diphosphomevalonate decarboxylase [Halobacteriovorax sp. HLS]